MITCEKCGFWNGEKCTDEKEFINPDDGEPCCRHCINAMSAVEAELKRLLFEAVPYIEKAAEDAEAEHNVTGEYSDYNRATDAGRLLEEIKEALREEK